MTPRATPVGDVNFRKCRNADKTLAHSAPYYWIQGFQPVHPASLRLTRSETFYVDVTMVQCAKADQKERYL